MDHRVFDAQVPALASRYRVVRWDVPGHGLSRPMPAPFTIQQIAGDLLAVLDSLDIECAVLVGHSMGGLVAQEIEFQHPERVRAVAMISSTCLTFRQPRAVRLAPLPCTALRLWPDRWTRKQIGWIAGARANTRTYASGAASRMSKEDRLAIWQGILRSFHEESGYRIRCSLLLMEGRWDWIVAVRLIRLLARRWADRDHPWRHAVVPGAGHNAQQDNPEFVNRELRAFLAHVAP